MRSNPNFLGRRNVERTMLVIRMQIPGWFGLAIRVGKEL
jgi:hypothetical protein